MNDSENNNTINNVKDDEDINENEPLEMEYGSSSSSDDNNGSDTAADLEDTSPKAAELSERTTNLINNFRNYVDSIDDNSTNTDDVELGSGDNVATTLLKSTSPKSSLAVNYNDEQQDTPILVKGALDWYNHNSSRRNHNFNGDKEIDDDGDNDYTSQEYGISPTSNQRHNNKRRSSFSNDAKYITHKINMGRLGIIRSRRIKRGICSVILLITILTLIGTLSSERRSAINEWNDEINELMEEEELNYEEELNEIKKQQGIGGSIMSSPDKQFGPDGYQPLPEVDIGSSSQADSGQQPQQAEQPKQQHGSGAKEQANNIISDVLSHANTMTSTSTTTSETIMEGEGGNNNYIEMANKYHPQWYTRHPSGITSTAYLGTNYNDALMFCAEQQGKKKLCKYEALCPGGSDNVPAGGYKESSIVNTSGSQQQSSEKNESIIQWVPIIDQTNSWVQVSSNNNNGCMIYNILHGGYNPSWGIDQEDGDGKDMEDKDLVNEEETRFVLCCDSIEHEVVEEDIASENEEEEEKEPCCWLDGIYYDGEEALQEALQAGNVGDNENQNDNQAIHEAWLDSGMDEVEAELEAAGVHDENDLLTHTSETKPPHEAIVKPQSDIEPDESSTNQETQINAVEYAQSIQHEPIWYYRTTGWTGQSYQDAVDFCAADHYPDGTISDSGEGPHGPEGGVLCPYEVLCPSGPNQHPFGGVIDEMELSDGNEEVSTQWAASSDSPNNWIQVSPGQGMCHTYMSLNLEMPLWGVSGEGNEGITRHVLCCRKMPSLVDDSSVGIIDEPPSNTQMGAPFKPESAAYLQYETQYQPVWYDRTTGWKGHSYNAAVEFCADLGDNHKLCPYEAYCPLGKNSNPYGGGFESEGSLLWAPVSDSYNDWVQIGTESLYDSLTSNVEGEVPCATYMNIHLQNPSWGEDGKGSWEFTGKILCCRSMDGGAKWTVGTAPPTTKHPSTPPTQKPSPEPTSKPSHKPTESPTEPNAYDKVVVEYNPKWYNREQGWKGQSYYEAVGFCSSLGNDIGEPMMLCPFEAYCPYGEGGIPFGGAGSLSSWAPVNDFDNDWVEIGSTNPCVMYTSIYSDKPSWGETGVGNEAETRNILCYHSRGKAPVSQQHTAPEQLADQAIMANELAVTAAAAPTVNSAPAVVDQEIQTIYKDISEKYHPVSFDRSQGWRGQTYGDALVFCAKQNSKIPCPYEVTCPLGDKGLPIGGATDGMNGDWVPIMDTPNGWVNIGEKNTCVKYNDIRPHPPEWGLSGEENEALTRHIKCCDEPEGVGPSLDKGSSVSAMSTQEKDVLHNMHPLWFHRKDGYHGTTHEEAELFCKTIGDMQLCPAEAYCPNGSTTKSKPLFLHSNVYQGESWAPVHKNADSGNNWINIGDSLSDGSSAEACFDYETLNGGKSPPWTADGSHSEVKQHVLCCMKENELKHDIDVTRGMNPIWLDKSHGYMGGSYSDAEQYCKGLDKKLCPYTSCKYIIIYECCANV